MMKNFFEIYLTENYVKSEDWLKLILKVSKINGRLKPWSLWVNIENNVVRYYIEIKRTLPPILGDLGEFLVKKVDYVSKEKTRRGMPYILTNNYKTLYTRRIQNDCGI